MGKQIDDARNRNKAIRHHPEAKVMEPKLMYLKKSQKEFIEIIL